jgi:hypothetical protein
MDGSSAISISKLNAGFERLSGIDYSAASIDLAAGVLAKEFPEAPNVSLQVTMKYFMKSSCVCHHRFKLQQRRLNHHIKRLPLSFA